MKRILLLLAGLVGGLVVAQAQDLITTKNGEDIQAKVLEVSSTEIKYKKFSNLDGPTFVINKNEVLMVRYENGEKDIFAEEPSSLNTTGEIYDGMLYKDLKAIYDPHYYLPEAGDPYSRGWAGVASFFIPGLGQAICGEWARGLCFVAGNIGLSVLLLTTVNYVGSNYNVETRQGAEGASAFTVCIGLGAVALDVWSIVDAVQVAKVKNMYYQDLRKMRTSTDIKLEPFLTYTPTNSLRYQPAAGLALKVSF